MSTVSAESIDGTQKVYSKVVAAYAVGQDLTLLLVMQRVEPKLSGHSLTQTASYIPAVLPPPESDFVKPEKYLYL